MSVSDEPGVAIASHLDVVDGGVELGILEERFGIPRAVFEPYLLFRPNKKALWICRRDLRAPESPEPHAVGFPFFYVNMRFPRPTTAAILRFGHHATRNRIDLADEHVASFIHRRPIPIDPKSAAPWSGHGYLIARHRGLILGLGIWRPFDEDEASDDGDREAWPKGTVGTLQGMCPRSWTARLGIEAPSFES